MPDNELTSEDKIKVLYGDLTKAVKENRPAVEEALIELAKSLGLNPLLKPFDIMEQPTAKGVKTFIYANKSAAAQLRDIHQITLNIVYAGALMLGGTVDAETYVVQVEAYSLDNPNRRSHNVGAVYIGSLKGDNRSNAIMKCWTKAIRRVTLDHKGVGFPDESELDSIGPVAPEAPSGPQVRVPSPAPTQLK